MEAWRSYAAAAASCRWEFHWRGAGGWVRGDRGDGGTGEGIETLMGNRAQALRRVGGGAGKWAGIGRRGRELGLGRTGQLEDSLWGL